MEYYPKCKKNSKIIQIESRDWTNIRFVFESVNFIYAVLL